jgi:hypothetical protein
VNRVLRRIFDPEREEVAGGWRLHNKELYNLYTSLYNVRVTKPRGMSWTRRVIRMEQMRKVYTYLARKPEGTRELRGPKRRWKDNIRMDLTEVGWEVVDRVI